jgi:DNA polymerase III epsilon subunit-like protein
MDVLVFDLETTGLDYEKDEITQFSCLAYKNDKVKELSFFLPAKKQISKGALEKTGYTTEFLKVNSTFATYKESVEAAFRVILSAIKDETTICGMNVTFDFTMLANNVARVLNKPFDKVDYVFSKAKVFDSFVVDKAIRKYTNGGTRKLIDLANLYDTPSKPDHNAINDVRATFEVMISQIHNMNKDITSDEDKMAEWMRVNAKSQRDSLNEWLKTKGETLYEGFPVLKKVS